LCPFALAWDAHKGLGYVIGMIGSIGLVPVTDAHEGLG
jgi:hypothetical protein